MTIAALSESPLVNWSGPYGLPRFEAIRDEDFTEAFDIALAAHRAEIDDIAANPEPPTLLNTIAALELSGQALSRIGSLFGHRSGADTNDTIQALEREISPKLSRHHAEIGINKALFTRIEALWAARESLSLTVEEHQVLERHWKSFLKSGAQLDAAAQGRLVDLKSRLSSLSTQFGQNVLADEKAWALILSDEAELAGLPGPLRDAMAAAASARGSDGKFAVTLSRSIVEPFLAFSSRRDLREQAFKAWVNRGANDGPTDNRKLIGEILALRDEQAKLLGYATYADLKLDSTMAKTPAAATELMRTVWSKALDRAAIEEADIAALIAAEGGNHPVAPWDWRYYAEKIRGERFDFSDAELKPYLSLDRIVAAAFQVAERLFGLKATERTDVALYHPDARLFEIHNASGHLVALFIGDYFARPSKRSGAWMSAFQSQHRLKKADGSVGDIPIIYNICNFAKPPAAKPALLSLDDARTVFHEFGHALHGMLSSVTYPSVSGTRVSRDFVELPSQLYEHWLTVPDVLTTYALHVETGEPMPEALLAKVLAARTFNSGHATVEFTASALVDMAFHTRPPSADPMALQAEVLEELGLPSAITMRHAAPHFGHVFSGGYEAQYYSYQWAEVLDADAFAAFTEMGDAFDPATAERLKANIYSVGGSVDSAATYVAFRGRMPTPEAMLLKKGLAEVA
jgi:peptidyl-dipeptidase Dcp